MQATPQGRSWAREVFAPVSAAAAVAFLLDLALARPAHALEVAARLVVFLVGAGVAFGVGAWLGSQTWPKRGRRLARWMLRRAMRGRSPKLVFLSDRPDFRPTTPRRVVEVVGFCAGASVILAGALILAGLRAPAALGTLAGSLLLITLWGAFVLVPYWAFARMGLRQVDAVRWLVQPMSRRYADRMRLSNGALLLIALGVVFNVAFRAGLSGDAALVAGLRTLAGMVASILVVAATGVAFYTRRERALVRELEREALAMGVRDGRGMTDGDFLPRLP